MQNNQSNNSDRINKALASLSTDDLREYVRYVFATIDSEQRVALENNLMTRAAGVLAKRKPEPPPIAILTSIRGLLPGAVTESPDSDAI